MSLGLCRTSRRVVLTGTPLQNNLEEYYVMISFVRPGLLGTRRRFVELFGRPIREGMLADSSPADVRLAKRRTFVLARRLAPLVQRRDDSVLRAILPPMEELVLYTRVAPVQAFFLLLRSPLFSFVLSTLTRIYLLGPYPPDCPL